ncbi:MAG: hypothetical protein HUU18_12165 [Phycisphaerales bacterium]|nr:hypothetical protein [Phycisphaerales bacterium]
MLTRWLAILLLILTPNALAGSACAPRATTCCMAKATPGCCSKATNASQQTTNKGSIKDFVKACRCGVPKPNKPKPEAPASTRAGAEQVLAVLPGVVAAEFSPSRTGRVACQSERVARPASRSRAFLCVWLT